MKFSIIIPTYNRAPVLTRAIDSVCRQTYANWELIIIDDGSTDNTNTVVATFEDHRIIYHYQENSERSAARNLGIEKSTGDWICFLDSDDEYLESYLSKLFNFINSKQIKEGLLTVGAFIEISETLNKKPLLDLSHNIIEEIAHQFILPTQACVSKSVLNFERFDHRFRIWEDTHLWLRIAAKYPIYQIETYLVVQHQHLDGSVVSGFRTIKIPLVKEYLFAIQHLKDNSQYYFEGKINPSFFRDYKTSKYKMYIYRARQNKQFYIAFQIWLMAMKHHPSIYFLSEFPKIFANKLNMGIYGQ